MELVWDDEALADLEDIFNWIAQESPAAAKTVVDRLFSSTDTFRHGRASSRPSTSFLLPRL
jgi:plasmid stabilization system protein ParE